MDLENHGDRGLLFHAKGLLREAIACFEQALAMAPNLTCARRGLATALNDLGTKEKLAGDRALGIRCYERALSVWPEHVEALYNLGVAWMEEGKPERAIFFFESAVRLNPGHVDALNNLGILEAERGNHARAEEHYLAALRVRPGFPEVLNNLALVQNGQGRSAEAMELFKAAVDNSPSYALAHNNLGVVLLDLGEVEAALESYRRCLALDPDHRGAQDNTLIALNYLYPGDDPRVKDSHRAWGDQMAAIHTPLPRRERSSGDQDRPLVVGYLSPDLFIHSVSYFIEAPLRYHNPARVQVIVYSSLCERDPRTDQLQRMVEDRGILWREVGRMPDDELARLIQADGVDILVELTGHMARNRLPVMAMKPAPVQATWIGYPGRTGLERIDHVLTDAHCDPVDGPEVVPGERVYLPGCFLCYTPPAEAPEVAPLPALKNGFLTFGCFNNFAKVTKDVMKVWAELLSAIPSSRLLLKSRAFGSQAGRGHVLSSLEAQGIPTSRVELRPRTPTLVDHLSSYADVDISLDPWPYAGTTTTCESLLMGVPCISMSGNGAAHNVGRSLMAAVGYDKEWVASNPTEYIAIAKRAAADPPGLAEWRRGLRPKMLASRLCDGPAFVERLEDTYRQMWKGYCDHTGRHAVPAVESDARPVLEPGAPPDRLSRLPLWEQQRRFFDQQHIKAWSKGMVPHYITSNPFMASSYARMALAFIEDQMSHGTCDPIHIVELGAGSGRFALGFLSQLIPMLTPGMHIRYVMTDVVPANIAFWRQHEAFKPYLDAGILAFAEMDLEAESPTAFLDGVGGRASLGGPVVLIANYVFDGVRSDAFHCCDGRLYESVARVQGGNAREEAPFSGAEIVYQRRPVETPYYDNPAWDAILDQYRTQLKKGSFLFPTTALKCIEDFRSISDGRLLVLSADRGYHDLQALEGADEPQLLAHGSFSLPVNYHALGLAAAAQGGQMFFSDRSDQSFVVTASLFSGQAPCPRTRRALAETLDGFGPGDFFSVKKALERTAGLLDLDHMMAHLRLSHWDARILDLFLPFLGARLESASEAQRQAWSDALERVLARHLPIGEDRDLELALTRFADDTGLSPRNRRHDVQSVGPPVLPD